MLMDLFGYFKRNMNRMNDIDKRKAIKEMKSIVKMLEKELNKGVIKNVG